MKIKKLLVILILLSSTFAHAQDKLEIIADEMRGKESPRGNVRILDGNVHLRQGEANLYCQYAEWYVEIHETILKNDVKFVDGSKILTAETVYYYDQTRKLRAMENVVFVDSLQRMKADRVDYLELEEHVIADHNVELSDIGSEMILTGQHAEYLRNERYAIITGEPVLIKKDSSGTEEIKVMGRKMELFNGGERAAVSDSVTIAHDNGIAKCNKAEYFKDNDRLLLQEEPVVWQKNDRLTGDDVELFFKDRKLNKAIITGHAVVSSPVDTTDKDGQINQILGDKITLHVSDNKLKEVHVEGKATSYYHIIEDGDYKGMNKIIGDKITMYLNEGEIERIKIESDPQKSVGIYYPPDVNGPTISSR